MIINIFKNKRKQCYNKYNDWHNSYGPDETESDGFKSYYINGKFHNIHGPAIIHSDGDIEYYLDDKEYSKDEWEKLKNEKNKTNIRKL